MNTTGDLIQNSAGEKAVHQVLIHRDFSVHLSDDQRKERQAFLELKKDTFFKHSFDGSTFFVKYNEDPEKMRQAGASYRKNLDAQVKEIEVSGEGVFHFIEGFLLSSYQFDKYLKEKKPFALSAIYCKQLSDDEVTELKNIQRAVFWARDMVNEPVSFLNAEQFAEEIKQLEASSELNVTVLEKTQIESLKMGGLLAVNQGSVDIPTFTIAEYKPANARNSKPIVLVGKGVVYDTGGVSLKPTANSMEFMKSDMGGAAMMVGAVYLAALQKLPLHIIVLVPATDNRPGLNAYVPGDIVTMYDGTTVEVLNTDAEGRMILADALAYSKKYDPELVVEASTLTGASTRAVGDHASVVMGNAEDRYFSALEKAGNESFERIVRFPFWDEYFEEMQSAIADLKNIGGPNAGMITAGKFLEHFVKAPFIHIDLAGPSWMSETKGYRTKGGSGVGVRLMYSFLKNYTQ